MSATTHPETIVAIRPLTPAELEAEDWSLGRGEECLALVLQDGSLIYASADSEGNRPGVLRVRAKGATGYADPQRLIGARADFFSAMTAADLRREGWPAARRKPLCLVFPDDTIAFAAADAEGNGAGMFFGQDPAGRTVAFA